MNILFKIDNFFRPGTEGVCSVPDELDDGTMDGMDKIEEIVSDVVVQFFEVYWKFEDEPDEKYDMRPVHFAEWSDINELYEEIDRLQKKITDLEAQCRISEQSQEAYQSD